MRFFFDTEFIEDGRTIDLLSIGIVAEDGREYYAESLDCDVSRASEWVKQNVLPHLEREFPGKRKSRHLIAAEVREFVGDKPEFWAYYSAYDWVVLCQLYGPMVDLPKGWPMWCRDIKQLCVSVGNPHLIKVSGEEHNALVDAYWNKKIWEELIQLTLDEGT